MPVEMWVHSPHTTQKASGGCCNRRTLGMLFVVQVTVIVAVTMLYLPSTMNQKYKSLLDENKLLEDHEVKRVLGLNQDMNLQEKEPDFLERTDLGKVTQPKLTDGYDVYVKERPEGQTNDNKFKNENSPDAFANNNEQVNSLQQTKQSRWRARRKKKRRKLSQSVISVNKKDDTLIDSYTDTGRKIQKQLEPISTISSELPGQKLMYSYLYDKSRKLEDILLLVIVNSAAKKRDRRDAIRDTWWTECMAHKKVRCFFFTDNYTLFRDPELEKNLLKESKVHKDMVFQPLGQGLLFGHRFLYQMQWARSHYKFKFLVRVDDDVMLCLHHLLYDLTYFRDENLQWGFLHCEQEELVYIDEGITMFSVDVVDKFLSQSPSRIRCHPFGDQTVTIWIQDLGLDPYKLYFHDDRIHHDPPASYDVSLFDKLYLCNEYIAIHGVYPAHMGEFWQRRGHPAYIRHDETSASTFCSKPFVMFWDKFQKGFYFKPDRCYKGDVWNLTYKRPYESRENDAYRMNWRFPEHIMDQPKLPPM